ncbi:DUF6600 domain-containing protein [Paraburkholderia kirstenboschensis]|uniref:DUF6600 domain-containing protein n=1 Tax=Paraburkholderia kirstenboschensis TaxID=1245436 RepID=A0ABZ0ET54_9BURK|nr:DUF6600 domain-containing protein [Paraburkholderia kirstenboschensis]WOD19238.1 DUF6600 domain-containing protein [Paraburkholderia kirstenboschensis]
MRITTSPPPSFHRTIGYSLIAAAAFVFAAQAALAQQAAPAPQGVATENSDPPGRVARLNYMAGTVTTEPAGAADWSYAQINRPLTTGDQLWNDQNARSELHIGSTAVRLGQSTSLDLLGLDDNSAQLKVAQGTLSAHVRELPPGSSYEIDTPNLALGLNGPGDYRVDVAPDGSSTTVTVRNGTATAYGDGAQVPITAGQQIRFAGTSLQTLADEGAPGPDGFDQWTASRDAAENRSISARYVSREIPGYQDLDANGTWRSSPQYGEVWVPRAMPVGWAPYRDGHWVWQAPWGWTWVDDAPWGFAPYHYGRWAYVDDSWAWVPGPVAVSAPPVYAPALVAFVGGGGGGVDWGVNLAIGGAVAAGVAWFPLGPGERWHPHWGDRDHWSPRYYERVNQTTVINNYDRNITNVHNTYINYRAPRAVTAVPATAFVHGQPVGRFAQKVDPAQWRNARINPGAPGIAPVRESYGPGQRNANYRPPAGAMTRPVVATRSPSMPPAYRDGLAQRFAQTGGRVPGAGQPIVRTSVPARMAGGPGALPVQNVRVVQSHLPGRMPGAAAGAPTLQPGLGGQAAPGAAGAAQNGGRQAGRQPGDVPVAGQPGRAGAEPERPGMPLRWNGQQAGAAGAPPNGVPRPPQSNGGNLGLAPQRGMAQQPAQQPAHQQGQPVAADGRHEPSWTQPHTPAQQAQQGRHRGGEEPQAPRSGWAQQPGGQPNTAMQPREVPRPRENPAIGQQPRAAQDQRQNARGAEAAEGPQVQQQPRQDVHAQVAQSGPAPRQQPQAPRQEFHPQQAQQRSEPRPQPQALQAPRQEFHPQQAQPRPEPRPQPQAQQAPRQEFHSQQAQPRPELRPQPQAQQAPRQEFHPQQAQPRPEPQPQQPRPQPQQHGEQRSAGGHDEHHKG